MVLKSELEERNAILEAKIEALEKEKSNLGEESQGEIKAGMSKRFTGSSDLFSTSGIVPKTMRNVNVTQHSVNERRVKELTELKE